MRGYFPSRIVSRIVENPLPCQRSRDETLLVLPSPVGCGALQPRECSPIPQSPAATTIIFGLFVPRVGNPLGGLVGDVGSP
jgi:hypothetical protein